MTPIKAIFFDAVGTLFHVRGTVGGIYGDVARRYGVDLSPQVLDDGFKRAFKTMDRLVYDASPRERWDALEKDWWFRLVRTVFEDLGHLPKPYETYFEDVYRVFEDWRNWELYPDVLEPLQRLKSQGYVISIISNFDRRIYPLCEGLGLSGSLDSIHLPRDVGAAKPDRRIFEAALSRHQLLPREAVHIGDHPVEDVNGARESGLIPLLIERTGAGNGSGSVKTLHDLFEWIQKR